MRARGLVLTAILAAGGCNYIAPPDPLALDPDVISIAILLAAGERQAHMLVGHPHRQPSAPPPRVTADLVGSDWRAAFTPAEDPSGCGGGRTDAPFPKICLQAALPEPIREEATYRLEGKGPKGSFTGETAVPPAPQLLSPGDTVRVPDTVNAIRIPIRYRASPEVGTLRPDMFATFTDRASGDEESWWLSVRPRALRVGGRADTLSANWPGGWKIREGSLYLLGIGWNYTNFQWLEDSRFPWPNFGVEGEGVYGYFDGSAKSKSVRIVVEVGG